MSTPTSRLASRIQKAHEFGAQYDAALEPDWKVIVAFYTALHWVAAAFEANHPKRVPNSHAATEVLYALPVYGIPTHIQTGYRRLRVLSEIARYDLTVWIEDKHVEEAGRLLDLLQDWAVGQMPGEWTK